MFRIISADGSIKEISASGLEDLPELMKKVEKDYIPLDQVINDIRIDGETIEGSGSDDWPLIPLSVITDIEITSDYPHRIALRGMKQSIQLLNESKQVLLETAESFKSNRLSEAQNGLIQGITALESFVRFLSVVRPFFQDSIGQFDLYQNKLLTVLEDLLLKQKDQNWNALADALLNDLLPQMESWKEIVNSIVQNEGNSAPPA